MTDRATPAPAAHSFRFKLAGAVLLVILADLFFFMQRSGSTLGLFALALLVLACFLRLEILRRWPSRLALAAATGFALVLAIDPGLLAFSLFWIALTFAVLPPPPAPPLSTMAGAGRRACSSILSSCISGRSGTG